MVSEADPAAAFRAAAQALNDAADQRLRREVYARFRAVAGPLGETVIREGAAVEPHRGGFAAVIARARMSQSNSTTGRNPGVTLRFATRPAHDLARLDQGRLFHPVFARPGRKRVWRSQQVPVGAFSRPFEAGVEPVRDQVIQVLDDIARHIAHTTTTGSRGL